MYCMSILEDGCPNYDIGHNTTDRLNIIPSSETKNVRALRSNSKANIGTKRKQFHENDLNNSNNSYQIKYCMFMPKSRNFKTTFISLTTISLS